MTTSPAARAGFTKRVASSSQIFGSTGSRLLSGSTTAHSSLENRFAAFFDSPSALLFNSGWDANVSFFATIPQPKDWVVYDELVHASVHSGLRASRVPPHRRVPFKHNDPASLSRVLERLTGEAGSSDSIVFLAMESLYSMDGDMAPLPAILDVLDEYVPRSRQCVVLDEAHSTGVYGEQGRGVAHALGETGRADDDDAARGGLGRKALSRDKGHGRIGVRLMTFGKAVGCSGAVLLCSPTIRSFLINFARPLIFSTALPHTTLLALESIWDVLGSEEGDQRRQSLFDNATHLHSLLTPLLAQTSSKVLRLPPAPDSPFPPGSPYLPSNPFSPILGLVTPEPHALAKFFLDRGFIVRPVVPPTVPPGEERVRICLRAGMEREVIDRLVSVLREWVVMKERREGAAAAASVHLKAKL